MKLTRRSRFITALVALISVLFMQLAAVAYACPDLQLGKADQAMSVAGTPDVGAMPECTKIDQQHANLCQSHCQAASQSVATLFHTSIESPALPLLAVIAAGDALLPGIKAAKQSELLTHITAPPPSLLFCVLRI
jgi:hypothetical protein